METTKITPLTQAQVAHVITIAGRYHNLHNAAKQADQAINSVLYEFGGYTDLKLTEEEQAALYAAKAVLDKLADRTTQRIAMECYLKNAEDM